MSKGNTRNWKIYISSIVVFVVFLIVLFFYMVSRLNSEALANSRNAAMLASKDVTHTLEMYFRDAYTINRTLAGNLLIYRKNKIPRQSVYNLIKGAITQHNNFLAIWTMWEPNAYDNADSKFAGDSIHDARGSFAIAYYYDNGTLKCELNDTLDYQEDFYVTPSRVKKPIIIDPFIYQYHGNPKAYFETSLISPIMEDDKFLGVIGIDLDLNELQRKLADVRVAETGSVYLLSNDGQIVTTPDIQAIQNIDSSNFKYLADKGVIDSLKKARFFMNYGKSEFNNKKVYRYFYPINLQYMVSPWYIMVEIPQDEIFDFTNKIKYISFAIFFSIIIIAGLLFNYILIRNKQERFNQVLFLDSRTPMVVMDPQSLKFIDCNNAAVKVFGLKNKTELLGKTPVDLSPSHQNEHETASEAHKRIAEARDKGSVFFEWVHQRPNGELWDAEVHLMLFEFNTKELMQFSIHDITERKRIQTELLNYKNHLEDIVNERTKEINLLNEELKQTNEELYSTNDILFSQKQELSLTLKKLQDTHEQLVHSEKMATIGILTSGVAHEINNPLNFIQGGCYAIKDLIEELNQESQIANAGKLSQSIACIETGIERIASVVKSIGRFSRKESVIRECNIPEIINNCLVILRNSYERKCIIEKHFTGNEFSVKGNEGKLHQIFLNILHNAVQSVDEDGKIKIAVNGDNPDKIEIAISDNGKGIPEEHLSKIFVPFFTTKEPGEGTGLGLYIVYTLVQEHNGTIECRSKIGEGTLFNICLPRVS